MKSEEVKKALESFLQYGWMWGNPHIDIEDWAVLHEHYKEDFNSGVEFKPNKRNRATGRFHE